MPFEIFCIVSGKVQGVMYRDFIQRSAKDVEVTGSIKNNADLTVEVTAQGTLDNLKEFVEYLHEGSILSEVQGVSVEWRTAKKQFTDFVVIYT